MKIERLIDNIPTSFEIQNQFVNGEISETEYNRLLENYADIECTFLGSDTFCAVCGNTVLQGDISELFDLIVCKNLSYLARVDGTPAIIRTDDGKVFKLYPMITVKEF